MTIMADFLVAANERVNLFVTLCNNTNSDHNSLRRLSRSVFPLFWRADAQLTPCRCARIPLSALTQEMR